MNYLIYTTPWSEGEVVANVHDATFPVGTDHLTGSVQYFSLEKLLKVEGLSLTTESDIVTAARSDSAWYPRKPIDPDEYERYMQIWRSIRNLPV